MKIAVDRFHMPGGVLATQTARSTPYALALNPLADRHAFVPLGEKDLREPRP